jgi:Cu+-exporting ATPase
MEKEEGLETATFQIQGLSCSCEMQIVQKRVMSLHGVRTFIMNPISNQMKLTYDPMSVSIPDIEKQVSRAGAKAVLLKAK